MNKGSGSRTALFSVQVCALLIAGMLFTLLPPATGPVLAVPFARSGGLLLGRGGDMRIVAAGPTAGSYVITGSRPSFLVALIEFRTLLMPAYPLICGELPDLED